jgi:uncharacterized protein (TIGR03083 family)
MAADPEIEHSLEHIRSVSRRMRDFLVTLPVEAWSAPTNCRPWSVRDLVAHVVSTGQLFHLSVERGVAGSTEPGISAGEKKRRITDLAESSPVAILAELEQTTAAAEELYERLSGDELEAICYHECRAGGNRSARWYLQHRLVEVAFHAWDLERSLGQDTVLDDEVASFLLPSLLESHVQGIYQGGMRGTGRFCLVTVGETRLNWWFVADGEQLVAERGGDADVTVTASSEVLARLVYGRASLDKEEQRGRAQVEGDRAVAERFPMVFPGP